jgi:predicted nuclease of predicted toxin-antitoxin system
LLFDQNLAPSLSTALADLFPGSTHVRHVGLEAADDDTVWQYAATHGLVIVSKDADFHERSFLFGPPPKVIWKIGAILREHHAELLAFEGDEAGAFLALG